MISAWKFDLGFKLFMSRRKPGRLENSTPLMPSSTKT